jgi:DNA excision repair protein ERCC-2
MKFYIDDLPVLFPYGRVYPEQYAYMCDLKRTLSAGGHCVLEMPSGTGKTISLLSLIVAYQQYYPEHRKLIYCSRTMSEIEKALAELKRLMKYRAEHLGYEEDFRGLGLTSRKNLCLHPSVKREKSGSVVDARCRSLTAGFVKERKERGEDVELCVYHDNLDLLEPHNLIPPGVFTLDGLIQYGEQHKQCPYFSARRMMSFCNVIIYSYHYLLDPKIAERVSKELSKDCIVVFDEAHNIDNVCIESLSIDLTEDSLRKATRGANSLEQKIEQMKSTDEQKLQDEYSKLVEGLREADEARAEDAFMANPTLPDDLLKEAVPGNIRRAEHFVAFLKRFIEYLKTRMKVLYVIQETPPSFLAHLKELTFIERKPLRFCAERLTSLVRTLELTNIEDFQPLQEVATFATLAATYESGFLLILEPFETEQAQVPNPVLHFTCLDASIAIKPVLERFSSVIITSGTISPLEMYPKMLNFSTVLQESYPMSLARRSFLPLIISKGSDQQKITSSFGHRSDPGVVRNYGALLFEFAKITPDGLVVFFPSYLYMEMIISMWQGMGVLDQIWQYKLILVETPDAQETSLALETYRTACENGKGAILLCVARGKVSEGIDFDHHYGRTVLCMGAPYQYTESRILKARLEFLNDAYRIPPNDFLSFDAMRHAAQCLGRVLRGKDDYGIMVLADNRFIKRRNQLPRWIADEILDSHTNLSTDAAVSMARKFLRGIAQPLETVQRPTDREGVAALKGKDSWSLDELQMFQREQKAMRGEGDMGREGAGDWDYMALDDAPVKQSNGANGATHANGDADGHAGADEFGDEVADEDLMIAEAAA